MTSASFPLPSKGWESFLFTLRISGGLGLTARCLLGDLTLHSQGGQPLRFGKWQLACDGHPPAPRV